MVFTQRVDFGSFVTFRVDWGALFVERPIFIGLQWYPAYDCNRKTWCRYKRKKNETVSGIWSPDTVDIITENYREQILDRRYYREQYRNNRFIILEVRYKIYEYQYLSVIERQLLALTLLKKRFYTSSVYTAIKYEFGYSCIFCRPTKYSIFIFICSWSFVLLVDCCDTDKII